MFITAQAPGLCLVILGGGGGQIGPPGFWLTHPPTHIRKFVPQEKNEIYQRGPNLEVDFRYTNFFLASDPPTHPPPRYTINQPLSKGLAGTHTSSVRNAHHLRPTQPATTPGYQYLHVVDPAAPTPCLPCPPA